MSKALKVVGTVVAVVGIVATAGALAFPAIAATAATAASAGGFLGISAATLATIGTVAGLAAAGIGIASAALQRRPSFSREGNALQFQTNPQSGLPYPIGRTRMSGVRIHADTYDGTAFKSEGKQDILSFAVLLGAGGPMEEVQTFRADKQAVTFDGSGNATGTFANYMAQKVSLGLAGASALALAFGGGNFPGWTSAHKLSGISHALWDLRYDDKGEKYGAGVPEPEWIGKWVKVYDPRLDSTYPGGSGAHRALDEATYEWSNNPALHALTWALGRWQNGKRTLGIGAPASNIRIADFVEAANVADANGWTCGGVEWSTDTKWAIFERMLQAGGAEPTMTGAMIGCRVNTPRISIATVTANELLDNLTFSTTKSRRDRFNTVIPRYRSESHDWEVISGSPVQVAAYVTEDGGPRTKEIDFPLVQAEAGGTGDEQAGQLAAYEIVNSREAGPIAFSTGPKYIGIKTGDCITLDCPDQGLAAQPVIIRSRSVDPVSLKIRFEAETETDAKHDFALGKTTTPPPSYTPTPPDLTPPTPSAVLWTLTAPEDATTPTIVIAGACEFPGADAVLIEYKPTAAEAWATVPKSDARAPVNLSVTGLAPLTEYEARVAYQSGDRTGDWLVLDAVTTADFNNDDFAANFNARNDRIGTTPTRPSIVADGSAVDHAVNENGSIDLSFEWTYPGGEEAEIDGFEVALFASDSSGTHVIESLPGLAAIQIVPAHMRAFVWYGLQPTGYYTMGVRAFRVVDPDIDASQMLYSLWRQPGLSSENPYRPANETKFDGDVIGTINGTSASNVASAVGNFNTRNDRMGGAIAEPTIVTNGNAVDHVINQNSSADISFEWVWGGDVNTIDGFEVMVFSASSGDERWPDDGDPNEMRTTVRPHVRGFILPGVDPTRWYTFAVRAFRVVDNDIRASGVIYSLWAKPSLSSENPYRPSSSVAWTGNVLGTINGTSAANVATWSGYASNGLNPDGTVRPDKVVVGSIVPGVINLAQYIYQGVQTYAGSDGEFYRHGAYGSASIAAVGGGVIEVRAVLPYQLQIRNPNPGDSAAMTVRLVMYRYIEGMWQDVYLSNDYVITELWQGAAETGLKSFPKRSFVINHPFFVTGSYTWATSWEVQAASNSRWGILPHFMKPDFKRALQ